MTTILVVDDSPVDQRLAGRLLQARTGPVGGAESTGFAVAYAANGREALAAIARECGPEILSDWCQERGLDIDAAWLRLDGQPPPKVTEFNPNRTDGVPDDFGCGGAHGHCGAACSGSGYGHGAGGDRDNFGYGAGSGCGGGHDGEGSDDGGFGKGDGCGATDFDSGDRLGRGYHFYKRDEYPVRAINRGTDMPSIGDYVIVRSRDQGCMCGEYRGHPAREVALTAARQIYSWGDDRLTLVDFAVTTGECRLSRAAPGEVLMLEA